MKTIEKARGLIKKYNMVLAARPDGTEGIKVSKKPNKKDEQFIIAHREEIITELHKIKAENKARWEARQAELDKKAEEYFSTADLRRCLVAVTDEYYNTTWAVDTLVFVKKEDRTVAYQPEYRTGNRELLPHETATIVALRDEGCFTYGLAGTAWVITPEQEESLLAEQAEATDAAEKAAAEKAKQEAASRAARAQKAAETREAKFQEARETGKPVQLRRWTEDCNDPREECSMDIVAEYALPDGSTKVERRHTW